MSDLPSMVECMNEAETGYWLWTCYTCGAERYDYPTLVAAELDGDSHECRPDPDLDAA